MTVPDANDCASNVLHSQRKGFPDPQTCSSKQSEEELILPFRLGKNRSDFLGCEARLVLALDYRQVHEVVLPLHRINFLALLIDCGRYDHLHNLHVVGKDFGENRGAPSFSSAAIFAMTQSFTVRLLTEESGISPI